MVSSNNFDTKAVIYDKYRPTYSTRYAQLLSLIGVNNASYVADIGAGTGKHSMILANLVREICCIEPNEEMLSVCRGNLSKRENTRFICATAEQVPVASDSFHYITVAQAFHLLDREKCKREFSRILKPAGKVILTWQSKNHNTLLFKETEKILHCFCPSYNRDTHAPKLAPYSYEEFFQGGSFDFHYFSDDHREELDEETFIGRTLSASYSLAEGAPQYREYITALRTAFHNHSYNGTVSTALSTIVYVGSFGEKM